MNRRRTLSAPLLALLAFQPLLAPLARAQRAPAPNAELAAVQGAWRGTLTYRDYANPERRVTLPTRLYIALAAPAELVLHYVYDDGPGKTVYAYERMAFDFEAGALVWTSGSPAPRTSSYRITAAAVRDGGRHVLFEREIEGRTDRYTLELGARALVLAKDEVSAQGVSSFRNRYEFTRSEG